MTDTTHEGAALRARLNAEAAQMPWTELQRFFAAGTVIAVSDVLDLIDVAASIASDDKHAVVQWMEKGLLGKASDAQASTWLATDAVLWTVVVKPWILVQQQGTGRRQQNNTGKPGSLH
jgi:hypothetical protein